MCPISQIITIRTLPICISLHPCTYRLFLHDLPAFFNMCDIVEAKDGRNLAFSLSWAHTLRLSPPCIPFVPGLVQLHQVRRFIQLWKSCRRFLQLCWRWDCVEPTLHIACDGKEDQDAKRPHVCPKTVLTKRYWLSVIWSSCCTKYSNILNQIGFGWHSLDMLNS